MGLMPLGDKVIIKRVEEEEKTPGGIVIPDTAKEKPMQGIVVAVGNGFLKDDGTRQPMQVKVGDKVLFGKWAGTEVKLQGEEHLILREEEIMAIIE